MLSDVPHLDITVHGRGDNEGTALDAVDTDDTGLELRHGQAGAVARVVAAHIKRADRTIIRPSDDRPPHRRVVGKRGDVDVLASRNVLHLELALHVPDAHDIHVAAGCQHTVLLLPIHDKLAPHYLGARREVRQGFERRHQFGAHPAARRHGVGPARDVGACALRRVGNMGVVPDAHDAVRGGRRKERLVVVVDETRVGEGGAGGVSVVEQATAVTLLPGPHAHLVVHVAHHHNVLKGVEENPRAVLNLVVQDGHLIVHLPKAGLALVRQLHGVTQKALLPLVTPQPPLVGGARLVFSPA
mmetsp:Transcript_11101/g.31166  ORF Transcript_11101/g.31166 Transcript_11101/m.31166 type:complete len:300 (-) Transcript_11101:265-1164(-)